MPREYFLHINTGLKNSFVMITDFNKTILSSIHIDQHEQAALINVSINQAIELANISHEQIAAISVLNGPGSYTGLRISLATAKGLALGWDVPLILHNYLDVLAYNIASDQKSGIMIKAREGEHYVAVYENKQPIQSPQHRLLEEIRLLLDAENVHQIFMLQDELIELDGKTISVMDGDVSLGLAGITLEKYLSNKFDDIAYSEPFYLKPAYVTTPKNNILHKN